MPRRIILHAGTPKTGTTALQTYLCAHRGELLRQGFWYPESYPHPSTGVNFPAKHQWMVWDLRNPDATDFFDHLHATLASAPDGAHTVILSTEGIYNAWWEFPAAGKAALRRLARTYVVDVWLWLRSPVSFFTSLYVQKLVHPRYPAQFRGADWSCDQMLDQPWFSELLVYSDFIDEARDIFGLEHVRLFRYTASTVASFLEAAGIEAKAGPEPRRHVTFGQGGVERLQRLNRDGCFTEGRAEALKASAEAEAAAGSDWRPFKAPRTAQDRVRALTAESVARIRREDGLELEDIDP